MNIRMIDTCTQSFWFHDTLKRFLAECWERKCAQCSAGPLTHHCIYPNVFEPLDKIGLGKERFRVCNWILRNLENAIEWEINHPEVKTTDLEFIIYLPSACDNSILWGFNFINKAKDYDIDKATFHMNVSQTISNGGLMCRLSLDMPDAIMTAHCRGEDSDPLTFEFSSHS